jgi:hypothetical protein
VTRRFAKTVDLLKDAQPMDRWLTLRWLIAQQHRWYLDTGGDPGKSGLFTALLDLVREETASEIGAVAVNLRGTYGTGVPCDVLETACDLLDGMSSILAEETEQLPSHLAAEVDEARVVH